MSINEQSCVGYNNEMNCHFYMMDQLSCCLLPLKQILITHGIAVQRNAACQPHCQYQRKDHDCLGEINAQFKRHSNCDAKVRLIR